MAIVFLENGPPNRINSLLGSLKRLPYALQLPLFNFIFGRFSRFYRTVGVKAENLGPYRVTLALANHPRVRNHIRGIHAVAIALPAEYAAGLVVAQHLSATSVVVLKRLRLDLLRPVRGAVRATATLTFEQSRSLREQAKGEVEVFVRIEDETGAAPVSGSMLIAWIPRKSA
ncbi:hypothetical protein BLA17378_03448 [Burkholderia aenigmatica]|uniref:DUF4442 domain-containing protein n=1 Tax=Burkholderia aenigmatica TaxID=2015348 RepID=A0ABY6XSG7_9BURK|nr:DUF4442 domain-containing protein [Burkholderia aenigmatica]VWC73761.1 hypothetical protein BLA17378_03448 [Burkholderia aenigmatica]